MSKVKESEDGKKGDGSRKTKDRMMGVGLRTD